MKIGEGRGSYKGLYAEEKGVLEGRGRVIVLTANTHGASHRSGGLGWVALIGTFLQIGTPAFIFQVIRKNKHGLFKEDLLHHML